MSGVSGFRFQVSGYKATPKVKMFNLHCYIVFIATTLVLTGCGRGMPIPNGTYKADDGSGESLVVGRMIVTMNVNVRGKLKSHTGDMELNRDGYVYVSGFTSVSHADFMSGRQWRWLGDHFTSVTFAGQPVNYRRQ